MRACIILLSLASCAKGPLQSAHSQKQINYDVLVGLSTHSQVFTSHAVLRLTQNAGSQQVQTLSTQINWERGLEQTHFDSTQPRSGDPWPLTMQHAISASPSHVIFLAGYPERLLDSSRWLEEASAALNASDVPELALETGAPLLDPTGYLSDLRRSFRGVPHTGEWVQPCVIAGLDAKRVESCSLVQNKRLQTWTCEGTLTLNDSRQTLDESSSKTVLSFDKHGLTMMDSRWSAVLNNEHAIAGLRQVIRR